MHLEGGASGTSPYIAAQPPRSQPLPCLVVGYDGSDWSNAAVSYAARRLGSEGRVVVVHSYATPPDLVSTADRRRIIEERKVVGRELLANAVRTCRDAYPDVSCETELIEGAPAEALLSFARAQDAAEIVIGSRGSGRAWTPIGSVSRQVLNGADRPVVVVPSPIVQEHGVVAAAGQPGDG
jgi:nucleotide-binding universal stress UspA family protein